MIIQNYRIFASVIYEIIRINNTSLPKIIIIPTEELNSKKADAADTKHTTSSNNANVDSSEKVNPSNEKQRGRIGTLFALRKNTTQSSETSVVEVDDGKNKKSTGWFSNLFKEKTDDGKSKLDAELMASRPLYGSINDIHKYLTDVGYIIEAIDPSGSWFDELNTDMNNWIDQLIKNIIYLKTDKL